MIVLKSSREIEIMRSANQIVAEVLKVIEGKLVPGINTLELDRIAEELIKKRGGKPAFKGYRGYEYTLCTSINEQVVHGIPGKNSILSEGDIISVDCGVLYKGYHGDAARTFGIGKISAEAQKLVAVTSESLNKAIKQMYDGNRLHDISHAVQSHAEANGFSVVRDYVGHAIGKNLHEDPQVPNFGEPGTGMVLKPGLVLAIEPMVNAGTWEVETLDDAWTVVTKDRRLSAHFEDTVAITENGPDILSRL
ncbi:type I methionyl aminopeptidase [bacterium]|nr:type I methionyl aminopeptidase [bacterium]